MKNKIYNKTCFYAVLLMFIVGLASCSQDEMLNADKENGQNLTFTIKVSDYQAFSSFETRAIGTPDAGKSEWENGDKVFVRVALFEGRINETPIHIEHLTYTYDGESWSCTFGNEQIPVIRGQNGNDIPYKAARIKGFYNPSLEWVIKSGTSTYELHNKSDKTEAVSEAFQSKDINIDWGGVLTKINFTLDFREQMSSRRYSRLRVVALPNQRVEIHGNGLRPSWYVASGVVGVLSDSYLSKTTTDGNGNAFFYFKWDEPTTFIIETKNNAGSKLKEKTFTTPIGSIDGMSYEIDMR